MVELIVTFALLAIFLAAASMCISHAIINYYNEQHMMAAYSVADLVLSEVKDEIRTMQASEKYSGYVKLRTKDGTGKLVSASESGGTYTGTTIEYVASNINDGRTAVQIDTEGCTDVLISDEDVTTDYWEDLKSGYLTMRYYSQYPEKNLAGYKNLYMDEIVAGTSAVASGSYDSLPIGTKVVWHAQEKLPVPKETENYKGSVYQGFTVDLEFSVAPVTDSEGNDVVEYVDVTVNVNDVSERVYSKTRRVGLQNTVYYTEKNTMYSDGAETEVTPQTVGYIVEYYDTLGNQIRESSNFYGEEGEVIVGSRLSAPPISGYEYRRAEGGGKLTSGSEITVRLIYEAVTYKISYKVEDTHIVNNPNPYSYRAGDDLGTIKIPSMERGYTFVGWFSDEGHTLLVNEFSSVPGYNSGNITLYGYVEKKSLEVEGDIDGMETDDSGKKFSEDMDPPDVLSKNTGYNADNIVYAINGYNDNYKRIEQSLEKALQPHGFSLDDVLVSTEVVAGAGNRRLTYMFLLEKSAIKDLNIDSSTGGQDMVEAFLKYANREDVTKTETITIEIPAEAVAVYRSEHNWNDSSSEDTIWEKLNDPEPAVYLHMTVDRQLVTWNGEPHYWTYYNYTIWMTISP